MNVAGAKAAKALARQVRAGAYPHEFHPMDLQRGQRDMTAAGVGRAPANDHANNNVKDFSQR